MRFRWLDDAALPGLAAVLESLWLGTAAALFVTRSPLAITLVTLAIMAAGVVPAVLARAGVVHLGVLRLVLVLVAAGLTAALVAAADPASREAVTRLALRDAFYVGVALWLGVRAGLVAIRPAGALRRSVRALTLVCAAVLLGRLADVPLPQAGVVVTAVVLAGVLFIALARLDDVMAVVDRRHGVTGWTWFLGVMTVTVVLLTAAGILAAVAGAGPLDWVFSAVAQAVGIVWSAVVFILYLIGYGVMRAIAWLASLVHLSVPQAIKEQDAPELKVQPLKLPEREGGGGSSLLRDLFIVVFAALAAGALVLALVGALRRVRTGERDDQVVEERESLASGADLLRGMGARIARLVPRRVRRPRPATPAEAVRLEYVLLESALARSGRPRPPAATARQYLAAQGAHVQDAATSLAAAYDLARYSQHSLAWEDVATVKAARSRFLAATPPEPT